MTDTETADIDSAGQEIANAVTFISKILLTGLILAIVVIGARLFGRGGGVALAGSNINVPANYTWILFAVLTLGHIVYANYLIRIILQFWESHDAKHGLRVFQLIKSSPNMFVFGLIPRTRTRAGGHLYVMDWSDPSTVFAHFAVLTFLASMLPWYVTAQGDLKWSGGLALWLPVAAGVILAFINWIYGGYWIIALSQLTIERDEAGYLADLKRRRDRQLQKK
jgi:hypothetical protein